MKRLLLAGLLAAGTISAVQACPQADTVYYSDQLPLIHSSEATAPADIPVSEELIAAQMEGCIDPSLAFTADVTPTLTGVSTTTAFSSMDTTPTLTALNSEVMSAPGTALRIVGRVKGDSNRMMNRKLHVSSNGYGWTINAPDNVLSVGTNGEKLSVHDLHEGDWVVAEGTKIGNSRIRALAIRKLGDDMTGYQSSAFYMPTLGSGYAMSITAGPDFRMQARESILGVRSQVAGERQEIRSIPQDDPELEEMPQD
jgi:hypothetical protein